MVELITCESIAGIYATLKSDSSLLQASLFPLIYVVEAHVARFSDPFQVVLWSPTNAPISKRNFPQGSTNINGHFHSLSFLMKLIYIYKAGP